MNFSRRSLSLYLGLIFLSGIAVGAFGHMLYRTTTVSATNEWRKRYTAEMKTRLNLRPDQISALNGILDETRVRFHEVREKMKPEFDAIKLQQTGKVRSILDDAQKIEYEKMRQEREANEKASGHPPGPGL